MKKLDLVQMENSQASANQRNCMLLGALIVGSAVGGLFSWGAGWVVSAGAFTAAATSDCF